MFAIIMFAFITCYTIHTCSQKFEADLIADPHSASGHQTHKAIHEGSLQPLLQVEITAAGAQLVVERMLRKCSRKWIQRLQRLQGYRVIGLQGYRVIGL